MSGLVTGMVLVSSLHKSIAELPSVDDSMFCFKIDGNLSSNLSHILINNSNHTEIQFSLLGG